MGIGIGIALLVIGLVLALVINQQRARTTHVEERRIDH